MGGPHGSALLAFMIFVFISSIESVILELITFVKKSKGYIFEILGSILGILALSLILTA